MQIIAKKIFAAFCAIFLFACNNSATTNSGDALNAVWEEYLDVKDALVRMDSKAVSEKSKELAEKIGEVKSKNFAQEKQPQWPAFSDKLKAASIQLAQSNEINAHKQQFEKLSETMDEGIRTFGLSGKTVYKQYCPMAFDQKGAYWFSDEKEIKNPYEAETMPECGEVKETIEF